MHRTIQKRLRAITLLIVGGLLLSSTVARTTYGSSPGRTGAGVLAYNYTAGIDWLQVYRSRSKNGDNDWMVYEVRVLRDQNQVFYDKRDGQLTTYKPLTSIQSGNFIALTDQQHRWLNPFVIDFLPQDSDVVVGTYTIVNQSHENHDPDKQRKKWDKFVSAEEKGVTIAKLIALPIGAGPVAGEVAEIYVGLLKTVSAIWDVVSPPVGHDVSCDGPVLSACWKFTGADLARLTDNQRRIHSMSVRHSSEDTPPSECGAPPDTEAGISIERSVNAAGEFGSAPPPKTSEAPIAGAPAGVWNGDWVERVYVNDSKFFVRIGATPLPARQPGSRLPGAVRIPRGPSYQVSVRELAAPGSAQVVFQTEAQGLESTPTQLPNIQQVPKATPQFRRRSGLLDHGLDFMRVNAATANLTEPVYQDARRLFVTADTLQVGNGVTLYLYATYSNNRLLSYAVRYVRQAADGATVADVMLHPAQRPLQ